jgi:hypothetical protein
VSLLQDDREQKPGWTITIAFKEDPVMRLTGICLMDFLPATGTHQLPSSQPWAQRPSQEWPPISLINQIQYIDVKHSIAGCAFLLDTGHDTLAVTAKHILSEGNQQRRRSPVP